MKPSSSGPSRKTSLPSGSAGHPPPPASLPRKALLGMNVETGSPGRKSFTQLSPKRCGQDAAVELRSPPQGNRSFLASPARCSSFGFRNLINTAGWSSTTGLRETP